MTPSQEISLDETDRWEARIAAIWSDLLDDPDIAADANFFEAGGDSMLLIVLLEQLRELTTMELDAADLFTHSTVRAQAEFLSGPLTPAASAPIPAPRDHARGRLRERSVRASGTTAKDHA